MNKVPASPASACRGPRGAVCGSRSAGVTAACPHPPVTPRLCCVPPSPGRLEFLCRKISLSFFFFLILRAANFQCSFLFFLQLGGSGSHFLITGLAIENRPRCSGLFPPTPDALKRISLEHQVHKFGLSSGKGAAAGKNALKENWFLVFGFCFSPPLSM